MINLTIDSDIFNKKYLDVLEDYSKRYLVLYGGAGSGKSVFATQRMIYKLLKEKRKLLVIRKIAATLKDSIFTEFKNCLGEWGIYSYCKINLSDLKIELPNGSLILFKGLDDPEKIKSISGITDILVEEATELNLEDFQQLDLRLRAKIDNQEIVLCYNPISKVSWVFERFHNQIDEDVRILHTTYLDNAFLSKRYVDTLLKLKNTNYTYYKIYCLGEFGTLGKQIFTNYRIEDLSNFDMSNIHVGIGLDFGFVNDPTAIGLFGYDRINKKIYIFDEIYKTNMLTDEIYNSIVGKQWHKLNIVADSAEPRTIRELQIKGLKIVPAQKGRDSIIHGLTWLQQQEIIIHKDCKNAIEEIANYTYKKDKKTGLYLNEPIDEYNHLAGDSLRYYSEKFSMTGQPVGNIKKVLGL